MKYTLTKEQQEVAIRDLRGRFDRACQSYLPSLGVLFAALEDRDAELTRLRALRDSLPKCMKCGHDTPVTATRLVCGAYLCDAFADKEFDLPYANVVREGGY